MRTRENKTRGGKPECAAAVSQDGKLVANRAYGLADVDRRIPLSQSSLIDMGSSHKQFVAAAVLLLAEEKRLTLLDVVLERWQSFET